MAARILVMAGVVALLWATGLLELDLPWSDPLFAVSGVTVVVYLLWSLGEGGRRRPGTDASQLAMYVVLLVSAVDSFLLELTIFESPLTVRWAGAALFFAGAGCRLLAVYGSRSPGLLRWGRVLQLVGLPLGLGSLAGTVVGALPGSIAAIRTDESSAFESEDPE